VRCALSYRPGESGEAGGRRGWLMSDPGREAIIQAAPDGRGSNEALERIVLWKVSLRLLPFLFVLYVVNILDRVNVAIARWQMLPDLGLEGDRAEEVYGLGFGIFYIGYVLFEVPSNLLLHRVGARFWVSRIMVSWGIISAAMIYVRGPASLYALRFLLGVAEAGFFPGIILYLSYWFPARQRARAVAIFMMASPVAGLVGNPVSGAILEYLSGTGGLAGWQWLFLLEGIPSVVLGFCVWFYLSDRPEQARWLTPPEREWLVAHLSGEAKRRDEHHGLSRLSALANPRVWHLIALYFTVATAAGGFASYAPTIVKGQFRGLSDFTISVLTAIPSAAAMVGMVVIGIHSDRTGERRRHVAASAFLGAVGWVLAAATDDSRLVLLGLVLAQVGIMSMLPIFWALPTSFLGGAAAAGGIALINSVGNLGGFWGPYVMSQLAVATHSDTGGTIVSYTGGMKVMAWTLGLGGLLALCLRQDSTSRAQ